MPTYEYECKDCKKNFELRQSMSEPPLTECPECKSKSIFKKISIPTVFTTNKTSVVQQKMSSIGGSSAFTPPLNWSKGRLVGVRPENKNDSKK